MITTQHKTTFTLASILHNDAIVVGRGRDYKNKSLSVQKKIISRFFSVV